MKKHKGFLLLEFAVAISLFMLFVSILTRLYMNVSATLNNVQKRSMALDHALSILADTTFEDTQTDALPKQFSVQNNKVKHELCNGKFCNLSQVKVKWSTSLKTEQCVHLIGI